LLSSDLSSLLRVRTREMKYKLIDPGSLLSLRFTCCLLHPIYQIIHGLLHLAKRWKTISKCTLDTQSSIATTSGLRSVGEVSAMHMAGSGGIEKIGSLPKTPTSL
jgi:hypothetical protein